MIRSKAQRIARFKTNPDLAKVEEFEYLREMIGLMAQERIQKAIDEIEDFAAQSLKNIINDFKPYLKTQVDTVVKNQIKIFKGDKGDSIKGDKGDSYVLTQADKREIASQIKVPIVEKIVEKTEVIRETPVVKEVAIHEKPNVIAEKLNTLDGVLDRKVIRGLEADIKTLRQAVREKGTGKGGGGGGMGNTQHERFNIGVGTTSVTTVYPIAGNGNAIFKAAYQGQELDKDTHFTIGSDNRTITFNADVQTQFQASTIFAITYIRG